MSSFVVNYMNFNINKGFECQISQSLFQRDGIIFNINTDWTNAMFNYDNSWWFHDYHIIYIDILWTVFQRLATLRPSAPYVLYNIWKLTSRRPSSTAVLWSLEIHCPD